MSERPSRLARRISRSPTTPRSGRGASAPRPARPRPRAGWAGRVLVPALLAAGVVAIVVVAVGQLGTATSSARVEREQVTAQTGVVQKTVTGTGNLEPVTDEDVDFQTSGTLRHVYVTEGEHVHAGQLLATLDDTTAALTLEQARATLAEARTTLTADEKTLAESQDTSATVEQDATEFVGYTPQSSTTATATTSTTGTTPARTRAGTTPTGAATTPSGTNSGTATVTETVTTPSTTTTPKSSSTASTVTDATIDADKLAIVQDEQTVKEDEQALRETRLRAPVSGTIVSLSSLAPGDSVSSGSDASSSSNDTTSSSDTTSGATGSSGATGASSDSSSSSFSFVEIDSLRHLSMTVSFTESDISELKVGQAATVSLDALSGVQLAAKVTSVSSIGTTSSDVVSYDATLTLQQRDARVKPGMSASATVIIKQAHGVTVPSSAVTGSGTLATVKELVDGKQTTRKVIVGLRGDSRDLIVSGLKAGATLVETETLPSTGSSAQTSTSSSGASASGALGGSSRGSFGGAGGAGGGFPGGGGPP